MLKCTLFLGLLLLFFQIADATPRQPLPAEQAFQPQIKAVKRNNDFGTQFIAQFKIASGYFLYREKLIFKLEEENSGLHQIHLPEGIKKQDDIHGTYQIYKDNVKIPFTISSANNTIIGFTVSYQGCSESGFCYPPITKNIYIENIHYLHNTKPVIKILNASSAATTTTPTPAESLLIHPNKFFALLTFFGFGLLLTFTPCILPMLPILSGIIVGQGENITTAKAFFLSLTYVLAMAITYAIAGMILATIGSNIQTALQQPLIIIAFSLLFVVLSLSLFGFYELQLPARWQEKLMRLSQKQQTGTYVGVAVMGFLSTLIVSPCVTAPLVGALSYIANTGNVYLGGAALFTMGMGMGIPLLILGTSLGKFLPKTGAWMEYVKKIFGILLLGIAIWMLSRILSPESTLFLWGILAFISAFTLFNQINHKILKFSLLAYGTVIMIGATLGNHDPFRPLTSHVIPHSPLNFITVKSLTEVKHQLQQGAKNHQYTLLDFSAQWCMACKIMEKHVFTHTLVINHLKNFYLIRADVTSNDKQVQELQKYFNVVAPPMILFFDKTGQELKHYRIIGEKNANQLDKLLGQIRDTT